MAIYTVLVYTAVQKTGLRECYDQMFWNTTIITHLHTVTLVVNIRFVC